MAAPVDSRYNIQKQKINWYMMKLNLNIFVAKNTSKYVEDITLAQ